MSSSKTATAAALAFGNAPALRHITSALRAAERLVPRIATAFALRLFFTPLPSKLACNRRVPAQWRRECFEVGALRVATLRHAAALADIGRPRVLLVHGWAGNALQMLELGDLMAAEGLDPVLLDLPAHGRSAGWSCTMPQIVASLFATARHAGPFSGVVAHSMGAVACLHAATRGLRMNRLVVLAPSASPAAVLQWFCSVVGLGPKMQVRMRNHIEHIMSLEQFETAWFAERVRVPVLVVHDRDDRIAPLTNGTTLATALRCARLMVTHGLSHRRILADPRVMRAVVDYVA
jgi:pimeloyl-ACP methyl ester carboxylesterase